MDSKEFKGEYGNKVFHAKGEGKKVRRIHVENNTIKVYGSINEAAECEGLTPGGIKHRCKSDKLFNGYKYELL